MMKRFLKNTAVRVRLGMWAFLLLLFFYTVGCSLAKKYIARVCLLYERHRPITKH